MPAKNFVMITIDDLRSLTNWGHFSPLIVAPNFERLADMGTTFERAITQVPLCNPSRSSVMTGEQPSKTGVLDNDTPWFETVNPADTLPAVLRDAGVYVAMYGKNFHDDPISPAHQAVLFDEFMPTPSGESASKVIKDGVQHGDPFASGRYTVSSPDDAIASAAVNFLKDTAGDLDQPFFLGVGINRPHLNWWVPSKYFDLYDQSEIRAALQASLRDGTIIPGDGEYFDVPPMETPSPQHVQIADNLDLWVDYIHAYLASISYADAKVGQVLDALAARPQLASDTTILLWSDNGYHLGDKDSWGKFTHWRESTEVPFILADPDAPGGQTANQIVSLVDIFPTVLDSMGVAKPGRLALSGDSLLPIAENAEIGWYNTATGKGIGLSTIFGSVSMRVQMPGGDDYRYTRWADGREELYNITKDPNEHVNRVNYNTGKGLTSADDTVHSKLSALMDDQLAKNGYFFSDGVHRTAGTAGDDMLIAPSESGSHQLAGAGGNDTYVLHRGATITEASGAGTDQVFVRYSGTGFVLSANVEIVHASRDATGNDAGNRMFGSASNNVLTGAGGNDTISGSEGSDTLNGGSGNDTLRGQEGRDRLTGGPGSDTLDGGTSNDTFAFAAGDSTPAAPDTIVGFDAPGSKTGDRIDLSAIDADTRSGHSGNQAFQFGGTSTGHVRVVNEGSNSVVLANTDSDSTPEVRIVIQDGSAHAEDYRAGDVLL